MPSSSASGTASRGSSRQQGGQRRSGEAEGDQGGGNQVQRAADLTHGMAV